MGKGGIIRRGRVESSAMELEGRKRSDALAATPGKGRAVLRIQNMGMGCSYERLSVAVGKRFRDSLTEKILVERRVEGHLDDTWRGRGLMMMGRLVNRSTGRLKPRPVPRAETI